jgi:hypothetical protein
MNKAITENRIQATGCFGCVFVLAIACVTVVIAASVIYVVDFIIERL